MTNAARSEAGGHPGDGLDDWRKVAGRESAQQPVVGGTRGLTRRNRVTYDGFDVSGLAATVPSRIWAREPSVEEHSLRLHIDSRQGNHRPDITLDEKDRQMLKPRRKLALQESRLASNRMWNAVRFSPLNLGGNDK